MPKNKCSTCAKELTKNNCAASIFAKGWGYCRNCITERARKIGNFQPMNTQKPGQLHTFKSCGHTGILPKKWHSNDFARHKPSGTFDCRQCHNAGGVIRKNKLKTEVFSHYCGGVPYCQCPGCRNGKENPVHLDALQLDHINENSIKVYYGKRKRSTGDHFWRWLKQNNYPTGFQVLCANCNSMACKGSKEQCPRHGQPH